MGNKSSRETFQHVVPYDVGNPGSGNERYRQGVGSYAGSAGPRMGGGGDAYGVHYFPQHKQVEEFGQMLASHGPMYDEFGSLNPYWAERQANMEANTGLGSDAFWEYAAQMDHSEGIKPLGGSHGDITIAAKAPNGQNNNPVAPSAPVSAPVGKDSKTNGNLTMSRGLPDPSSISLKHGPSLHGSAHAQIGGVGYFVNPEDSMYGQGYQPGADESNMYGEGTATELGSDESGLDGYDFPAPEALWVPRVNPSALIPHGVRTGLERPVGGVVLQDIRGKTSVELEREYQGNTGHGVRQHVGMDSREIGAAFDDHASDVLFGNAGHYGVV